MKVHTYVIMGNPRELAINQTRRRKMWSQQHRFKNLTQLDLAAQHEGDPLEGLLNMDIIFKMPFPPKMSSCKKDEWSDGYHDYAPDMFRMADFIRKIGQGIIFTHAGMIVEANMKKVYGYEPCTEFTVREL